MGASPGEPGVGAPVRRRRRRRSRPWRVMLLSALICIPLALAIPASRYFGWLPKHDKTIKEKSTRNFDVVLSEATVRGEGAQRRVVGLVRNNSRFRYEDVEVAFTVRDRTAAVVGTVSGKVKSMEPNALTGFETAPLPDTGFRIALREINGTRR